MNWIVQNSYWKLFWRFMYINWRTDIAYRVDFFMMIVSEILFFVTSVGFLYFLFESGSVQNIGGFSLYDFYFAFALSDLMNLFTMICVLPSMNWFKKQVHSGDYDLILLRPKSWYITNIQRSWLVSNVLSFGYSFLLIGYVFDKVSLDLYSWDLLYVLILVVYGFVLYSILYWIAGLICLYVNKFNAMHQWVSYSNDVKQYPKKIFPNWVSWVFRIIMPMMLIVSPIYDLMDGSFDYGDALYMFLILVMFGLLVVYMWKDGLKRYESAA